MPRITTFICSRRVLLSGRRPLGVVPQVFARFQQLYGIDIRTDREGRARPQGSTWDIGAYEYVLAALGDLAVSGTSQNSITLAWTVPGEEGVTGQPALYDIRYASGSITEANWEAATQVQGEPVPGSFGTQQSFTITGLNPGATYYVAVKVLDEAGHTSALSNVVSEPPPPPATCPGAGWDCRGHRFAER